MALAEYYDGLVSTNKRRLAQADFFGLKIIPLFSLAFVSLYWIIGILKYNQMV